MERDLERVNRDIERTFTRSLEKTLTNSSRALSEQILESSRTGNFSIADSSEVLIDGLEEVARNTASSALQNGVNLAVNQAFTRTKTRSYETQRSRDSAAEFGRSLKQQSKSAVSYISNNN